jgi:hypothetical protein
MSDLSPWIWRDQPFTENDVGDWFGFVYEITNIITGKRYIGRKYFYSTNRVKQKGKKNRKIVRKQSDWQKYYGSSKTLIADIELHGKENFKREILSLHEGRGDVNYHELKEQIVRDVLNDDTYYNDNIFTRFFRKKNKTKSEFKE